MKLFILGIIIVAALAMHTIAGFTAVGIHQITQGVANSTPSE